MYYNNRILLGNISKLYKIQGIKIIKAITIGSNIVQQKVINWSNLILGKLALAQIKIKIIIQDFIPKIKPQYIPSIKGSNTKHSVWLIYNSIKLLLNKSIIEIDGKVKLL